jgi:hypothetical protein
MLHYLSENMAECGMKEKFKASLHKTRFAAISIGAISPFDGCERVNQLRIQVKNIHLAHSLLAEKIVLEITESCKCKRAFKDRCENLSENMKSF